MTSRASGGEAESTNAVTSVTTIVIIMQEWYEIQFNGVYYNPYKKGKLAHPSTRERKHRRQHHNLCL